MQVGEVNPSQWLSETAPWPLSAAPSGRAARRQVPASSRSARAPISAALAPRNETAVLPCPREPTERSAARVTARCRGRRAVTVSWSDCLTLASWQH
jgi:hypothetical protein